MNSTVWPLTTTTTSTPTQPTPVHSSASVVLNLHSLRPDHIRVETSAQTAASPISMHMANAEALRYLPTVSAKGYVCNWCTRRDLVYASRDAFLRHVECSHPTIGVDAVEPHIPLLPSSARHASHPKRDKEGGTLLSWIDEETEAKPHMQRGGRQHDSPRRDDADGRQVKRATNGVVGSAVVHVSSVQPIHRDDARRADSSLPGRTQTSQGPPVSIRTNKASSSPDPVGDVLLRRCKTISLPRVLSYDGTALHGDIDSDTPQPSCAHTRPLPMSRVEIAEFNHSHHRDEDNEGHAECAARAMGFAPDRFPCELCGRVLKTEIDLLRHLESRHSRGGDAPTQRDVSQWGKVRRVGKVRLR